jgi:hypothetical protein
VQNLFLDANMDKSEVETILFACTGVVNIFVYCPTTIAAPHALARFDHPRRLVIDLDDFSIIFGDDGATVVHTLTYLELNAYSDWEVYDPYASRGAAAIATLTHITHTTFNSPLSPTLFSSLSSHPASSASYASICPSLKTPTSRPLLRRMIVSCALGGIARFASIG